MALLGKDAVLRCPVVFSLYEGREVEGWDFLHLDESRSSDELVLMVRPPGR